MLHHQLGCVPEQRQSAGCVEARRKRELHPCAKLTHKIAVAAAAAAVVATNAAAAAAAAKILAWRRRGKKNQDFYENLETEKIAKNIEKINGNR